MLPSSFLVPDGQLGGAKNIVTTSTVLRSEAEADETGKYNSGRADGVLESVGFKQFILAMSYPKMALAIVVSIYLSYQLPQNGACNSFSELTLNCLLSKDTRYWSRPHRDNKKSFTCIDHRTSSNGHWHLVFTIEASPCDILASPHCLSIRGPVNPSVATTVLPPVASPAE